MADDDRDPSDFEEMLRRMMSGGQVDPEALRDALSGMGGMSMDPSQMSAFMSQMQGMFALGIIDTLTPGELNGGERIAGTGTIDAAGAVGPIGGIRQKLYGARDAGATVFLAPEENCDEVVGHVPDGLQVFRTGTLEESLDILEVVADGGDTSKLPVCTANR